MDVRESNVLLLENCDVILLLDLKIVLDKIRAESKKKTEIPGQIQTDGSYICKVDSPGQNK